MKHNSFPWLVLHAADVLNTFLVGPDGLTAYERIKGRAYSSVMLEFGSGVLYKLSAHVEGGVVQPRWEPGIWLGKHEHVVCTQSGVVIRCIAAKPHPEKTWNIALFNGIMGLQWDPAAKRGVEQEVEAARELPRYQVEQEVRPMVPQTRQVKITQETLHRLGFSDDCAKYPLMAIGDRSARAISMAHLAACRKRVEGLMSDDPFSKHNIDVAKKRQDEYLARPVELGDIEASAERARAGESLEEPNPT